MAGECVVQVIVVAGMPSPFACWMLHVVKTVMQTVTSQFAVLDSHSVKDFQSDRRALGGSVENIVLFVTAPASALARLLTRSRANIVVAFDQPHEVISYLLEAKGMSVQTAVREYLKSVATLNSLASASSTVRLSPAVYGVPFRTFLVDLLKSCQLAVGPALLAAISNRIVDLHPKGDVASVGELVRRHIGTYDQHKSGPGLNPEREALAEEFGRQYGLLWGSDGVRTLNCPQALYIADGATYEPADRWLPMLGPARCFLWGPYIHLPEGSWLAKATVDVRDNHSGNKLRCEVLRGLVLHRVVEAALPEAGRFEFEIEFEVIEPLEPLEVTFTLCEGAIEGLFRLANLEFRRIGAGGQGSTTPAA